MKAVETIWSMFLMLCEAREIADEAWRKAAPAAYLRGRVARLVVGDRVRGNRVWHQC